MTKKKKKITSKGYVRSPQSDYVRDRCDLLKIMQLLGIISDINMRMDDELDGKPRWCLTITSKVNDDNNN